MVRKVAIISDGIISNVIVAEAARGTEQVDITDQKVGIGWKWNGIEFSPPDPVATPIPKLTPGDIIDAFTDSEQDAILTSTDNKVEKLLQQLSLWGVAGLPVKATARLQVMFDVLVHAGLLTQARADAIYAQLGGV